jgi:hypothetical protein
MSLTDEVWYNTKDHEKIARIKALEADVSYKRELIKIKKEELKLIEENLEKK